MKEKKIRYIYNEKGKKKIYFEDIFLEEIKNQITEKKGEYYNFLENDQVYKSVDAPIGYKILEALYVAKKHSNNKNGKRKNIISGYPRDVFKNFLSEDKRNFSNLINLESQKDIILKIFSNLHKNIYIITVTTEQISNNINITPYFEYKDYKMADGHAYSIIGFNEEKNEVQVVNPWNNNKILYFSIDEFLKIFTGIQIAKLKT